MNLDGGRITTAGTLIGWSRQKDVTVLRVPIEPGVPALQLRRTNLVGTGEKIYIVGYSLDLADNPLITEGVISQFYNDNTEPPPFGWVLLYDVVAAGGSSGSAILDAAGRVIGMDQIGYVTEGDAPLGINKGITADEILDILDALKAGSSG